MHTFLNRKIAVVLFVIFLMLGVQYFWIARDNSVQGKDTGEHILFSMEYFYDFSDIVRNDTLSAWKKIHKLIRLFCNPVQHSNLYWPNGINLPAAISCSLFGKSLLSVKVVMLGYLFILLLSVYLLGERMQTHLAGLLSAVFLFFFPVIFQGFRQFQLDSALTAMVALTILLLLKSENFKNSRYSIFSGLSFGWMMLVKGQGVFFVIGPIILILYRIYIGVKKDKDERLLLKRRILNLFIFLIISWAIASFWWGPKIGDAGKNLLIQSSSQRVGALSDFENKYSPGALLYYLKSFSQSLGIVFLGVFMVSAIFWLKSNAKDKEIYLLWFFVPLGFFSLAFMIKQGRYVMPILVPMALVIGWWASQIKDMRARRLVIAGLVSWGLLQFYVLSFCSWHVDPRFFFYRKHLMPKTLYETPPPSQTDYKIQEVARIIRDSVGGQNRGVKIGMIAPVYLQPFHAMYLIRSYDKSLYPVSLTKLPYEFYCSFFDFEFILLSKPVAAELQWPAGEEFRAMLTKFQPETVRQNEHMSAGRKLAWEASLSLLEKSEKNFELIAEVPYNVLENKYIYYIYKRI